MWSAAPQTTLWGGPGPKIEPGTGGLEARTLTTRPPHLLQFNFGIIFNSVGQRPKKCYTVQTLLGFSLLSPAFFPFDMSIPRFTHPHQQLKGKIAKKSLSLQIHVWFFMERLKQSFWTKKTFWNFVQCSTAWPFLIPLQREGVSWKKGFHWRRETGGISCPAHACNSRGLELFPASWVCERYVNGWKPLGLLLDDWFSWKAEISEKYRADCKVSASTRHIFFPTRHSELRRF